MNNAENRGEKASRLFLRGLKHLVLHNASFKLTALLISVVLWAGLISQDVSLTRDKVFNDVSVNVTGTDTMKRNGYIVTSDLAEALQGVTATAAVPPHPSDRTDTETTATDTIINNTLFISNKSVSNYA